MKSLYYSDGDFAGYVKDDGTVERIIKQGVKKDDLLNEIMALEQRVSEQKIIIEKAQRAIKDGNSHIDELEEIKNLVECLLEYFDGDAEITHSNKKGIYIKCKGMHITHSLVSIGNKLKNLLGG